MRSKHFCFTQLLLDWNEKLNERMMPWKGETDPYKIWLSEVILQQTRVEQGWAYYDRFVKNFPTVCKLAEATETKVFKLWEGLGYYSRCKNLIATAKLICKNYGGKFPDKYDELLQLKGVGPYTAAAISSFAFKLPYAVIDGNVYRVLARFFGIDEATDTTEGKKLFATLAQQLLDINQPGAYNQAIMDFGAVICKPALPLCHICVLNPYCSAFRKGKVNKYPVKTKAITRKNRWFYYLVVRHNNLVYVHKREHKDIWQNLYEFILIETPRLLALQELPEMMNSKNVLDKNKITITRISKQYKQELTHQRIYGQFLLVETTSPLQTTQYEAIPYKQLQRLPFPKLISRFLLENDIKK